MSHDFLFVEKYRPKTIEETILPDALKKPFQEIVDSGSIPNMLFSGTAGLGKTTVAKAICEQLGCDYIVINASEEGNIDTLRTKIRRFASSVSLSGQTKVVILDEADYLNPNSTQPALRRFIEDFSDNCRFILTCNFKNRIIDPLHSRCGVYEFNVGKKELEKLCAVFFKRLMFILDTEEVKYDKKQLAEIIMKYAPDWRRTINECQRNIVDGELHLQGKLSAANSNYQELFKMLKEKDFKAMRKWVVENIDVDASSIFRAVYDIMDDVIESKSKPQLVLLVNEYQYKDAFVADHEMNVVAFLTEVMANIDIK